MPAFQLCEVEPHTEHKIKNLDIVIKITENKIMYNDFEIKQCLKYINEIMLLIKEKNENSAYKLYEKAAVGCMGNKKIPRLLWSFLGMINAYLVKDGSTNIDELEDEYIKVISKIRNNN